MNTTSKNLRMRHAIRQARSLIVLFIAAALTTISATPTQLAAVNNLQALPQTATVPMLPGTTQPNLHDGTENSLISKLQDALTAVNASDTATACDSLTAFINASQAQSGKKLTAAQVKQLVDSATVIKSDLGCQ